MQGVDMKCRICRRYSNCSLSPTMCGDYHDPEETVVNEHGARQSKLSRKWLDFDTHALMRIAARSAMGNERYGPGNWRKISEDDHIEHAIDHIIKHLAKADDEDNLAAAVCRLLFAMGVQDA